MILILISFVAGVLTILAPCVLPLLPIIIGGSIKNENKSRPFWIAGSLAISIILFTLLLKASTIFIMVPASFWKYLSGIIVLIFGIITLWPNIWEKNSAKLKLSGRSNQLLNQSAQKSGVGGSILIGMSLGPVFSSCSPTYSLALATVLPQNFTLGLINIISYSIGLAFMLLLISVFGQQLVSKLKWAANPHGLFKKILGVLFILVALFIITGADKDLQTYLLDKGFFDVTKLESKLIDPYYE